MFCRARVESVEREMVFTGCNLQVRLRNKNMLIPRHIANGTITFCHVYNSRSSKIELHDAAMTLTRVHYLINHDLPTAGPSRMVTRALGYHE